MNTTSQNIAIAGAGISGLAAAALLARDGHSVVVFDAFEKPLPVGSGLVIQPVGQQVLDDIGVGDVANAAGAKIRRMLGHNATTGRRVLDVWYDRKNTAHFGLGIHRADLFAVLYDAALNAGVEVVPNARIISTDAGRLTLEIGTQHGPFDLIIDASGAHSPLSPLVGKPLSYGAIWGTVEWPGETKLPIDYLSQIYRRADRMIGVLPIGAGQSQSTQKAAVFWSLPRDGHAGWVNGGLEAWKHEAQTLWPAATPFLAQITTADQMTMATYTHGTLKRPYGDRLAIIGDAAHRASPQLGQGANMALLDALALRNALRVDSGQAALKRYAAARRWHVRIYQAMSWTFTPQYQSDSRILPFLRDNILFPVSQIPPVPRLLTRLVRGDMIAPIGR